MDRVPARLAGLRSLLRRGAERIPKMDRGWGLGPPCGAPAHIRRYLEQPEALECRGADLHTSVRPTSARVLRLSRGRLRQPGPEGVARRSLPADPRDARAGLAAIDQTPAKHRPHAAGRLGRGLSQVWLGVTAEDAERFRMRWPIVSRVPAARRFLSYEPAIAPLGRSTSARQIACPIGSSVGARAAAMRG